MTTAMSAVLLVGCESKEMILGIIGLIILCITLGIVIGKWMR